MRKVILWNLEVGTNDVEGASGSYMLSFIEVYRGKSILPPTGILYCIFLLATAIYSL